MAASAAPAASAAAAAGSPYAALFESFERTSASLGTTSDQKEKRKMDEKKKGESKKKKKKQDERVELKPRELEQPGARAVDKVHRIHEVLFEFAQLCIIDHEWIELAACRFGRHSLASRSARGRSAMRSGRSHAARPRGAPRRIQFSLTQYVRCCVASFKDII